MFKQFLKTEAIKRENLAAEKLKNARTMQILPRNWTREWR